MTDWNSRLMGGPGPDRVERLLHSCRSYYHAGDIDIAVLLLDEAKVELINQGGELFSGNTRTRVASTSDGT